MKSVKLNIAILVLALFGSISCMQQSDKITNSRNTVEVKMVDYAFAVTDSIPSGWNTFKMINQGEETHEFVLHRLPEGKTFNDAFSQVIQPLDSLQQLLINGKIDSAEHEKAVPKTLPKWIRNAHTAGGGGLITPGQRAKVTLDLDPGRYMMSCFIPSENGRSHVFQGMVRPITVVNTKSESTSPEADVAITSSGHEISREGSLGFGIRTIAVHVAEPPADSINSYKSMYIAKLTDTMDQKEDLRDFDANPPSIPLLGGALAIPSGDTAYVTVKFTVPGPYTFVFPHEQEKTQLKKFVIR